MKSSRWIGLLCMLALAVTLCIAGARDSESKARGLRSDLPVAELAFVERADDLLARQPAEEPYGEVPGGVAAANPERRAQAVQWAALANTVPEIRDQRDALISYFKLIGYTEAQANYLGRVYEAQSALEWVDVIWKEDVHYPSP